MRYSEGLIAKGSARKLDMSWLVFVLSRKMCVSLCNLRSRTPGWAGLGVILPFVNLWAVSAVSIITSREQKICHSAVERA